MAFGMLHFRYFNVAGARETGEIGEDHHPETHLVPIILEAALRTTFTYYCFRRRL